MPKCTEILLILDYYIEIDNYIPILMPHIIVSNFYNLLL